MFLIKIKENKKSRNVFKSDIVKPFNDEIEIIKVNDYEVWGYSEYAKYIMSKCRMKEETLKKRWEKYSKGYNFVIAVYKEDIKSYDIFSVPCFNEVMAYG